MTEQQCQYQQNLYPGFIHSKEKHETKEAKYRLVINHRGNRRSPCFVWTFSNLSTYQFHSPWWIFNLGNGKGVIVAIAGIYNFTLDQGSTWTLQIIYNDPSGTPINLTGYTAEMQIRRKFDSDTPVLTLSTSNGGITIVGATGTLNLIATDEQAAIDPGLYVYDLELSTGGVRTRLIQGTVTVSGEVTR